MRIAFAVCIACTSPKPTTLAPPTAAPIAVPLTAASQTITSEPIVREDISPPFSLTASDGSGLHLVRVEAKAVVEGPLAFTELHLFFHNPEQRQREGRFQI